MKVFIFPLAKTTCKKPSSPMIAGCEILEGFNSLYSFIGKLLQKNSRACTNFIWFIYTSYEDSSYSTLEFAQQGCSFSGEADWGSVLLEQGRNVGWKNKQQGFSFSRSKKIFWQRWTMTGSLILGNKIVLFQRRESSALAQHICHSLAVGR